MAVSPGSAAILPHATPATAAAVTAEETAAAVIDAMSAPRPLMRPS